jgi:hypothetical protein
MTMTFYWQGQLKGWLQCSKDGRWRALTPAGALSHHPTSIAAMEALQCSA